MSLIGTRTPSGLRKLAVTRALPSPARGDAGRSSRLRRIPNPSIRHPLRRPDATACQNVICRTFATRTWLATCITHQQPTEADSAGCAYRGIYGTDRRMSDCRRPSTRGGAKATVGSTTSADAGHGVRRWQGMHRRRSPPSWTVQQPVFAVASASDRATDSCHDGDAGNEKRHPRFKQQLTLRSKLHVTLVLARHV